MFKIDMYEGEYDSSRNSVVWWWSDTAAKYCGWIRNPEGVVVGDFSADSLQDAERGLGVKLEGV